MRNNKGSKSRDIFSVVTCAAMVATMLVIGAHFASGRTAKAKSQNIDDWKAVEQALGKSGSIQPGEVYKVSLPRSDLKVTAGGVELRPALALGSWIAFKRFGEMTVVMGDLVLTEEEVTPVLTKLQEGGIETTALHNHVLHENPRVVYMHIHAMGDAVKIAKSIHDCLMLTRTPFTASPAAPQNQQIAIDIRQIDQIIGRSGKVNGGVYQVSIARGEKVMDHEMELPAAMGLATAINFQPTGNGRAAITGDFVLIGSEVNPVIKALRDHGIEVTALHSHMLTESPRLFFMHFWANDDAIRLAHGLRAALDQTNSAK
jgi:uncharacterized protein DUF1259